MTFEEELDQTLEVDVERKKRDLSEAQKRLGNVVDILEYIDFCERCIKEYWGEGTEIDKKISYYPDDDFPNIVLTRIILANIAVEEVVHGEEDFYEFFHNKQDKEYPDESQRFFLDSVVFVTTGYR